MKSLVTHNGKFHADEVFAIAILKKIYPDVQVIRSRDVSVFSTVDARVDVGSKYNPDTLDFDHHQAEGAGVRENGIAYASCGLIWKHYGKQLVADDLAWENIDKKIIQGIDADDNGITIIEKTHGVKPYDVGAIIDRFNYHWSEEKNGDGLDRFFAAIDFAGEVLDREILRANSISVANDKFNALIKEQGENTRYIISDSYFPWKKQAENYSTIAYGILFNGSQWSITSVNKEDSEFEPKYPFPKKWAGLTHKELEEVSGVKGALFCHKALFYMAAQTKEAAIALVEKSLEQYD